MINRSLLLADLQRLLSKLEADLRVRVEEVSEINADLKAQHASAVAEKRTAAPFKEWREDLITQVGVAWILGCVFVRFLEDNNFLDAPLLSGAGDRLAAARDQQTVYVRKHPTDSDREYLLHVFAAVGKLPVLSRLYDAHNPLHLFGPSADGAQALLHFWQQADPATGALRHDFTDAAADTRFIGDLYQDLSESARKRFALLQTPVFVEEFILDRTLEPAIQTFGLDTVKMIDPTCGSGHFLLGAFQRLLDRWFRQEPGTNPIELVRRSLDAIHGIDLNPFAVAIARFRLLVTALRAGGISKVRSAPAWPLHVYTGDSLLFGPEPGQMVAGGVLAAATQGAYRTEDAEDATRVLSQRYHAVVGNPPYITVKDKALNKSYRDRFKSCHRKYSLSVPFFERFFDLAAPGGGNDRQPGGYVGKITANSFMKREFGKKLVETFIPRWDLTHIISTDGAYLQGYGTPTVIVFGRNQQPVAPTIRTLLGIKGEPSTPKDPSRGLVWLAILDQIDRPGSESDFISSGDSQREAFHSHPWSIGGGGAAELKEQLDESGERVISDLITDAGFGCIMGEDEVFTQPLDSTVIRNLPVIFRRMLIEGDNVRDWMARVENVAVFPYDERIELRTDAKLLDWLWPFKTLLAGRKDFGNTTYADSGRPYWEYHQIPVERNRTPLTITFGEVATHNHFVLDRGGKLFNRTAPVIKLPPNSTEDDHLGLLGLLNSSTACFWLKQVCQDKGSTVDEHGARQRTLLFENFFQFGATKIVQFPIPAGRPLELAREIDRLAQILQSISPGALISDITKLNVSGIEEAANEWSRYLATMIGLQEELDWTVYCFYGLTATPLVTAGIEVPRLSLGQRAFEIVLARKAAAGEEQSAWFARHGSVPITEIPGAWPKDYRELVERRIKLIESDKNIGLIERPEFKRRWNITPWAEQLGAALRTWLLDRLETLSNPAEADLRLFSTSELAERARKDSDFVKVSELYSGRPDFEISALVADLVISEAIPSLPGQRYKEAGLRKREQWEHTWAQQRQEDAIVARLTAGMTADARQNPVLKQAIRSEVRKDVGEILVPPKYTSGDFQKSSYWRMRGKVDVPKERWISYPGAERSVDPTLVIGWAGWDHLQQAQALAAHYERLKSDGAVDTQLARVLASLHQLIPWLLQWHNEIDPAYGERLGNFFKSFVEDESRRLQLTADSLGAIAMSR